MPSLGSLLTFERRDSVFTSLQCHQSSRVQHYHYDLLSAIFAADQLNIDLFPITWMVALDPLGRGAQGLVQQALVDIQTNFAFKRSRRSGGTNDQNRYCAIISEMVILRTPRVRDHPNIINLEGLGWDVDTEFDEIFPVLIFPKATYSSLYQYFDSPENLHLPLEKRLMLCGNIISAMLCMHSCRTMLTPAR